jgi:hypothetical protein
MSKAKRSHRGVAVRIVLLLCLSLSFWGWMPPGVKPALAQGTVIAADDFESGGWNGNPGQWGGAWQPQGEAIVESNAGRAYSGSYSLRLQGDGTPADRGQAARLVNLSAYAGQDVRLRFWARYQGYEVGDELRLYLTDDGGASWTAVYSWGRGSSSDPSAIDYTYHEILLGGYLASGFGLRFYALQCNDNNDQFWVDNLEIVVMAPPTATPTPTSVPTATPTPSPTPSPTPVCSTAPLNFNGLSITSYSDQDSSPQMAIEDGGATLHIWGNAWKKVDFPYYVGPGTMLEFDFRSESQGEVHGIGMDDDNNNNPENVFELYGTQNWARRDYENYAGSEPAWKHYVIPVGNYFSGSMLYITFIADDDSAPFTADSRFSNVRVCGGATPTPSPTPSPTPTATPTPVGWRPTPTPIPPGVRYGLYDHFTLCPPGASGGGGALRPKPPLLRECSSVLTNSDFEPSGALDPWVVGEETNLAVVSDSRYSCDRDGRDAGANAGNFSMLMRCDTMESFPPVSFHPWAYQSFEVPAIVSSTQDVDVEMAVSLYYIVPPAQAGTEGRAQDQLQVVVEDLSQEELFVPQVVADGGIADRGAYLYYNQDLGALFPLENYAGQDLSLRFKAPNDLDQGDTEFYMDQVRCEICTTVRPPAPEPDKRYRIGGHIWVLLSGQPVAMPGVDVWAIQIPDGTPSGELDFQSTYSIQDSTYSFYNLSPGTYRIYAEVWVSGNLYSAATTVDVTAGSQEITNIDLTLI